MGLIPFWNAGSGTPTPPWTSGPVQPFRRVPNCAYVSVEIAFAANWNDTAPVWSDVTTRVRFTPGTGITFTSGRNDEYQIVPPGTFQIDFNNLDRALDPTWTGSPYYPNILPVRPCRITCYYPDPFTAYTQFIGVIDEWVPHWTPGGDAYVTATGNEMLSMLSRYKLTNFPFLSTSAVGRLQEICKKVGWPTAWQSFLAGAYPLVAGTQAQNSDALSECQRVADGQVQVLYQNRSGILTTRSAFTFGGPTATFADNPKIASGELFFNSLDLGTGGPYLFTEVEITDPGQGANGADYVATKIIDPTWVAKYGQISYKRTISPTTTTNAQSVANQYATSIGSASFTRPKQVTIFPLRDPTNLFPKVLPADQFSVFTFKLLPPGGGPRLSINGVVRSRTVTIRRDNWRIDWMLSPT